jgi:hypothetical protein
LSLLGFLGFCKFEPIWGYGWIERPKKLE